MKAFIFTTFVLCMMAVNSMYAQEVPMVYTTQVGACEVSLLSDGQGEGNTGILIGATPEMIAQCIPDGKFPNAYNAFLIKTPKQTILVDAGMGRKLLDNLKHLNVSPEQVDVILLTHLHGDHIGGLMKNGAPTFPKAEVMLALSEYEYWIKSDNQQAKTMLDAYKDRLTVFQPESIKEVEYTNMLVDCVKAVAAYGHTPGHTAYMVESKDNQLLIWGDLTHAMAIQMPYPQVAVTYDVNPELAIVYREQILKYVAEKEIPIAGMHIAYPGMGKVKATGENSYSFEILK